MSDNKVKPNGLILISCINPLIPSSESGDKQEIRKDCLAPLISPNMKLETRSL